MPLFFFDIDDGDRSTYDDVGTDCVDMKDARRKALAALPDVARDALPSGDVRDFSVTVRDGNRPIYTATLSLFGRWLIAAPT